MIPLLIVASIWYLVVTTVLSIGQYYLERHYGRGAAREQSPDARSSGSARHRARHAEVAARPPTPETPMSEPMVKAEHVHKRFGRLEVLKGIVLEVAPGERRLPDRPVRLGQVHLPALHQPPREDRRRPALGRRRAGRLPPEGRQALRAARIGGRRKRAEIGMVFQRFNLFPHMTALGNVIEAPMPRSRASPSATRARAGRELLERVGLDGQGRRATRRGSRAASSSGWRSPGRWPWSRS